MFLCEWWCQPIISYCGKKKTETDRQIKKDKSTATKHYHSQIRAVRSRENKNSNNNSSFSRRRGSNSNTAPSPFPHIRIFPFTSLLHSLRITSIYQLPFFSSSDSFVPLHRFSVICIPILPLPCSSGRLSLLSGNSLPHPFILLVTSLHFFFTYLQTFTFLPLTHLSYLFFAFS